LSSDALSASAESRVPAHLPSHVAIIMDGNGRWAKQRLMSRISGHEKGAEAVRMVVRTCRELGIPFLTLYAFSTENWQRPKTEVNALMALLRRFLRAELNELIRNGIRLHVIGGRERLPDDVQRALADALEQTRGNSLLQLNLALNYGGRDEIIRAMQGLAADVQAGRLLPSDITEPLLSSRLDTAGIPDPDLLIRTGGEMRVSNFLLWQLAYTEIFVTPTLWPDFDREQFEGILKDFKRRERRYGRV
jgi:undecaprenyl diphosphate synthase